MSSRTVNGEPLLDKFYNSKHNNVLSLKCFKCFKCYS